VFCGGLRGFGFAGIEGCLERKANPLGDDARCLAWRGGLRTEDLHGLLAAAPAVAAQVALRLAQRPQALHGGTVGGEPDGAGEYSPAMAVARARVFEYRVDTDPDWTARSDRGGLELPRDDAWTPEHLVLAALARCTLTSLEYHARRAGLAATAAVTTRGVVTRRETDGQFAFVDISAKLELDVEPRPEPQALRDLVAKAERDCFVGASLTARPAYTWTIDGKEL